MLVRNANDVDIEKFYCSRSFGDILIKKGLSPFGFKGDKYIFAVTKKFKSVYASIPKYKKFIEGLMGGA